MALLPVPYCLCFLIGGCSTNDDGWSDAVMLRALGTVLYLARLRLANAVGSTQVVALLLMDAVCVFLLEYGCSLEDDIVSDTSSMFRRVLVSLATVSQAEGRMG